MHDCFAWLGFGSYEVRLTVTDSYGDADTDTTTIRVSPEVINLGGSDVVSFSGEDLQRHHYRVAPSSGVVVDAELTSCTGRLLGRTGQAVPSYASSTMWPDGVSSPTRLVGKASGDLYLAVEKPAGCASPR